MLERLWSPGRRRRSRTPAELFALADRLRREGRPGEAARMVAAGLTQAPDNLTGHLLAARLHVAARTLEPARREFAWVLARDPAHPRALLGLARLALEEGDVDGCRQLLGRALRRHPDFPEAQALLGALTARPPAPAPAHRLERLRPPPLARAFVAAGPGGDVIAAQPVSAKADGDRLARAVALAGAVLRSARLGPLRRVVVVDDDAAWFARTDAGLTLALALPRPTHVTQGLLEVNRLWAAARHELAVRADPAPGAAMVSEAARRVS
jgi:tetratricopeptide (TPR) repeat protein